MLTSYSESICDYCSFVHGTNRVLQHATSALPIPSWWKVRTLLGAQYSYKESYTHQLCELTRFVVKLEIVTHLTLPNSSVPYSSVNGECLMNLDSWLHVKGTDNVSRFVLSLVLEWLPVLVLVLVVTVCGVLTFIGLSIRVRFTTFLRVENRHIFPQLYRLQNSL